ncbi:MAG: HNH endonuclease family protein, partial [Candidatus Saccharimonadales bacterium]
AVQEQVSRDGYERSKFSPGWARVAGCDIRNRILQRDLSNVVLDEDNCLVLSGVLEVDPFTSESIDFIRGPDTSSDIHIEHLVAVSDAWMKGAQDLSYQRRHQFYNDPLNLVAVDGIANIVKGDKDAADWLPQQEYRCLYIARQIAVKLKYDLWVRDEEYVAMRQVLNTCPAQILPIESPVG